MLARAARRCHPGHPGADSARSQGSSRVIPDGVGASGGPSSRRMDETPAGTGHDVERERRGRVAVEDEGGLDPEWPEPSPPVPPPLRRRARGRWVAGVARGLADHWGVPAIILRIPLAVAGLTSGILVFNTLTSGSVDPDSIGLPSSFILVSFAALVAYSVLWIVVPRED